ncbi:hypothetical protein [Thermosulfurimonas dismutans]|uniref:DUF429 domain-containing protein n=1 Tax=Thermosulfurimonas dismutans TaxID=999894 RepID=A0A179D3D6_9BACT|nr:hypothetical protein [Thermosulfurimonas dismutans]OAQ20575.1 hypothetical protein TDIS_1344 [Thermosulfurimonas dismutans]
MYFLGVDLAGEANTWAVALRKEDAARNWVVSYHGLQAVPVRGKILAEALSPVVETILETHPRVSLYFCLQEEMKDLVFLYKPRRNLSADLRKEACRSTLSSRPGASDLLFQKSLRNLRSRTFFGYQKPTRKGLRLPQAEG